MVKITNPLGDVKIGKQGEVVYQRRHGEQIRRMAAPKRAIPSQRQIDHRQLYRTALAWRKQLSLANRRYLDGYCIANGVVDRYHIPLPWSRFALKIYLQAVKFHLTNISITEPEYQYEKKQSYETGDDAIAQAYADKWAAQTFTPEQSHTITSVKLKLYRNGAPGTLYVGIKETDGSGHPTGDDLCSGNIDGNSLTTDTSGEWYQIDFGDGAELEVNTLYAIVCHIVGGNVSNRVCWRRDSTGVYPGGEMVYSINGGVDWTSYPDSDCMFQEWTSFTIEGKKTATLHVRHPALLIVVHKRGELTINGYDTLSSLDEEYLTGQVGLDVEAGDLIKATTLPGIEYSYEVV